MRERAAIREVFMTDFCSHSEISKGHNTEAMN